MQRGNPLRLVLALRGVLLPVLLLFDIAFGFSSRAPPTPPQPPSFSPTTEAPSKAFVLGPGSRVAVSGAEGVLGRLVSKKLFQSQLRPYLVVPSLKQTPSGLGLDQYKGLTRYISTSSSAGNEETTAAEVDGLVMCSEKGYTANEVKSLLEKISPGVLKRVVMLSSVGVNRREDFMLKLRQYPINLDERHAAEEELMSAAAQQGFSYTLVRVGKLRGGGGEQGLGFEYYDDYLKNPIEAKMEEDFDANKRGFTLSYCDNIDGDTSRVLTAQTMVKALDSDHVENVAVAIVSESGRTYPNPYIGPWEMF